MCLVFCDFYFLVDLYFDAMAPKDLFIGLYGVCLVGGLGVCLECVLVVVGIGLPGGGFLIVAGGSGGILMVAGSALTQDESEGRVGGGEEVSMRSWGVGSGG